MGLDYYDLTHLFDAIICSEDTEKHKPEPEPILKACDALNQKNRDRVLMIGDSPYDVVCAKKALVKSAVVAWSDFLIDVLLKEDPDYVIKDLRQLINI